MLLAEGRLTRTVQELEREVQHPDLEAGRAVLEQVKTANCGVAGLSLYLKFGDAQGREPGFATAHLGASASHPVTSGDFEPEHGRRANHEAVVDQTAAPPSGAQNVPSRVAEDPAVGGLQKRQTDQAWTTTPVTWFTAAPDCSLVWRYPARAALGPFERRLKHAEWPSGLRFCPISRAGRACGAISPSDRLVTALARCRPINTEFLVSYVCPTTILGRPSNPLIRTFTSKTGGRGGT